MKLKRLIASEVNGILNFDINFNDDLSFLIGINGSGKTTALKLLLGLITPSYKFLNKINFKNASLECINYKKEEGKEKVKEEHIKIIAKKEGDYLELELMINGLKTKDKIELFNNGNKYVEEEDELFTNRKFDHLKVVRAIQDLKTPVFLGLDRRIFHRKLFEDPRREYERRNFHGMRMERRMHYSSDPMDISIIEIQELVNDYVRETARKQPQFTEEFKSEILSNSIKYYDEEDQVSLEGIEEKKLYEKRDSVEKALKNLAIGNFKDRIDKFFEEFIKLNREIIDFNPKNSKIEGKVDIEKFSRLFSKMMRNSMQLNRIDDIIELSQKYQAKIADLQEPINRLNEILYHFFEESKKKIEIQPNGEFKITLPNGQDATPFELSSGEKQILIMITHLIFYEDRNSPGIFIIDEPELSLHLGWQEIFVSSIIKASPKTQFILATHSPTIIGGVEYEEFCIDIKS